MTEYRMSPHTSKTNLTPLYEKTKKEGQERKRNILYLILNYLSENNLDNTANVLQKEAQISDQFEVCENIDLDIILQEYCSYYFTKFQRHPKVVRKISENVIVKPQKKRSANSRSRKTPDIKPRDHTDEFQFEIISLEPKSTSKLEPVDLYQEHTFAPKPLCEFENYSNEWREMADQIIKEIVPKSLGVSWNDCVGLEEVIERLKETTTYPTLYPKLFADLTPWKGILLYGPPGTGKTLLAKAFACESQTTFINVTSSTFISKWRGDSEKMVKVLFDVAKFYAPTTIFIDELDAMASISWDSQHEASRRFKSELLTQIDGIRSDDQLFVLATTNTPWNLDPAMLRRFEKRILVELPDEKNRMKIFTYHLSKYKKKLDNEDLKLVAKQTSKFSGSDIKNVCKEVAMNIIRERISEIKIKGSNRAEAALRDVCVDEVSKAIEKVNPCISDGDCKRYLEWSTNYGST